MKETINLIRRLEKPARKVDVVLDTDAFNEIDDQYALAYLIKSDDRLTLKAIYAAPFSNRKAETPKIGMEKSFDEIINILDLMGRRDLVTSVFKGSTAYLQNEETPVYSDAVLDLVDRAKEYSQENPLYVIAIGAITNIASAIIADPQIKNKIVIIWLGGHAIHWPVNNEFNLRQDIAAARVVFHSEAPLILVPCDGVVSEFRTTGPELEHHLKGKNNLCDYLIDVTRKEAEELGEGAAWSRVIWDVVAVAWLLEGDFLQDCIIHSPIPEYDMRYAFDVRRHFIKYVYQVKRDHLFEDLFRKLGK